MAKQKTFIAGSVALLLLTGAGWWEGLDIGPGDIDYRRTSYDHAVSQVMGRLGEADADDLMARCRAIVDAGIAWHRAPGYEMEKETESGEIIRGPEPQAWLLCVAALRRVGESADERWGPVLQELQERWLDAADRYGWLGGEHIPAELNHETGQAYKRIFLDGLEPVEIIELWRQRRIELASGEGPRRSASGTGASIAVRELSRSGKAISELLALYTDPEPAVRRASLELVEFHRMHPETDVPRVALLADPDPGVRGSAARGTSAYCARAMLAGFEPICDHYSGLIGGKSG